MVLTKTVDNRWIKRYRLFFIVGVLILTFQILLAIKFFSLNGDITSNTNVWTPHNKQHDYSRSNNENFVRNNKKGLIIDDEDASNIDYQKINNNAVKTINKPNQTRLRLEELDFVPACEIVTREAISAIHRAKTQKCKQEIANITCLIKLELLYPASLPNFCPNNDLVAGKSLGCFKDEKSFRLLTGYYSNNKNSNSPEYCIRLCLQSGFPYAGVQYSTECFCGSDIPPSTAKVPDSSCNMKCPADPHLACGGYFTINIYQTGIQKFTPQTAVTPYFSSEKPAKIVFLLTLNGRALRQIKRMIKMLYHRDHYYYIHIDVRQDYLFRELLSLEKQFANIRLTRRRFATIWGGASLLEMLLSTMQELLKLDWKWDFVLNLSESDYPVKTTDKLVNFLSANKNKNFVKSHGRDVQRFIQKQGLDKTFVECDAHMWRTGDRRLPWGIQIDGGSDWIALSKEFVKYVASEYPDKLVAGLLVVFEHTLLPAESFFHTVIRNSKFCNTYIDNNLHVTNWKRKLGCKCQYKHVVDWCGCSPNDFKPEDWVRILNTETRQLFFARKFEPIVNQAIVLQLEQWLYGEGATRNTLNLNSYWHNIYSHFDLTPTDDSLLTLAASAARIKARHICNLPLGKVSDITSYHRDDAYQQTLILVEFGTGKVEFGVRPRTTLHVTKSSMITQRLEYMFVSTDYDQKEQISRNFLQSIGPYSEPVLIYQYSTSPLSSAIVQNVSYLWINPIGHLIEVSDVVIDENSVVAHIKPAFKQPLLPGLWTVKLLFEMEILAEVKFLVTPLEFLSGSQISESQVNYVHSGSGIKEVYELYDKLLPSPAECEASERLAISNAKRFGINLQEWIDSLVVSFYHFKDACFIGSFDKSCEAQLPNCYDTNWSSFAPDPKSYLGKINQTSGKFDPW